MNMNELLSISRTGLNGLQKAMDVTANNIANVNTTGYKERQVNFRELLNNATTANEASLSADAGNITMNRGLQVNQQSVNFKQGSLMTTDRALDLGIEGAGFFGVRDGQGNVYLTRDGNFSQDANGQIVTSDGYQVDVALVRPVEQWPKGDVKVDQNGVVQINETVVGQIVRYLPENEENLVIAGQNLYELAPGAAWVSSQTNPEAFGQIHAYKLENSSVDLAQSMTDMIITQRSYSLNSRVLQSTDDMYNVINRFTD